ncbi:MAG: hypothetical protein AAF800_05180 [Planctomycetota bacterium]
MPAAGLRVKGLDNDGAARAAGLRSGQTLVALDGQPIAITSDRRLADLKEAGVLRVWHHADGYRDLRLPAGDPGVWVQPRCIFGRWYHLYGNRDRRWDGVMLAGLCLLQIDELDLAETAFADAISRGYPVDGLMKALAFRLRMQRGDWASAGSLLPGIRSVSRDEPWWPTDSDQFHAARAAGDAEAAVRLIRERPGAFRAVEPMEYVTWLALHRAMETLERDPGEPSLAELARELGERSLLSDCEPGTRWKFGTMSQSLNQPVLSGEVFESSPRAGSYRLAFLRCPHPVGDFGLRVEVQFKPHGDAHPDYINAVMVGLVNYAEPNQADQNTKSFWASRPHVLGLDVRHRSGETYDIGVRSHSQIGRHSTDAPWLAWSWKTRHTIEFYRVGSRGQVLFDGKTLYDMPVDPELDDLALHLQVVGFATRFHRVEWFALEPKVSATGSPLPTMGPR